MSRLKFLRSLSLCIAIPSSIVGCDVDDVGAVPARHASSSDQLQQSEDLPEFFRYGLSDCLKDDRYRSFEEFEDFCSGHLNGYRESLEEVSFDDRSLPVLSISSTNRVESNEIRDVIFYITGGPLHPLIRFSDLEGAFQGLEADQLVVQPMHQSTWLRSSGSGDGDLVAGMLDVEAALAAAKVEFPEARFHIIGVSWGGYFASRLDVDDDDNVILVSTPLIYSGFDLLNYFLANNPEEKRKRDTSFPFSIENPSRQFAVNRFDYVEAALNHIGDESFVLGRTKSDASCRIVIYGTSDPMLAGFDRPDGYSTERHELVISRDTGHDVIEGYSGFFREVTELDCKAVPGS